VRLLVRRRAPGEAARIPRAIKGRFARVPTGLPRLAAFGTPTGSHVELKAPTGDARAAPARGPLPSTAAAPSSRGSRGTSRSSTRWRASSRDRGERDLPRPDAEGEALELRARRSRAGARGASSSLRALGPDGRGARPRPSSRRLAAPSSSSRGRARLARRGAAADVYALGVSSTRLSRGRLPLHGEGVDEVRAAVLGAPPVRRERSRRDPAARSRGALACLARTPTSDRSRPSPSSRRLRPRVDLATRTARSRRSRRRRRARRPRPPARDRVAQESTLLWPSFLVAAIIGRRRLGPLALDQEPRVRRRGSPRATRRSSAATAPRRSRRTTGRARSLRGSPRGEDRARADCREGRRPGRRGARRAQARAGGEAALVARLALVERALALDPQLLEARRERVKILRNLVEAGAARDLRANRPSRAIARGSEAPREEGERRRTSSSSPRRRPRRGRTRCPSSGAPSRTRARPSRPRSRPSRLHRRRIERARTNADRAVALRPLDADTSPPPAQVRRAAEPRGKPRVDLETALATDPESRKLRAAVLDAALEARDLDRAQRVLDERGHDTDLDPDLLAGAPTSSARAASPPRRPRRGARPRARPRVGPAGGSCASRLFSRRRPRDGAQGSRRLARTPRSTSRSPRAASTGPTPAMSRPRRRRRRGRRLRARLLGRAEAGADPPRPGRRRTAGRASFPGPAGPPRRRARNDRGRRARARGPRHRDAPAPGRRRRARAQGRAPLEARPPRGRRARLRAGDRPRPARHELRGQRGWRWTSSNATTAARQDLEDYVGSNPPPGELLDRVRSALARRK